MPSRFDLRDSEQKGRLQVMDDLFKKCGAGNAIVFLMVFLPEFLRPLLEALTGGHALQKKQVCPEKG